jgi:hypothetical protein
MEHNDTEHTVQPISEYEEIVEKQNNQLCTQVRHPKSTWQHGALPQSFCDLKYETKTDSFS